ncbi:hypothetical protein OEA41_002062 [Lepraria neglecta]|uniref:NAD(P)-binding domain-containing protein n=1 Tax=Lepraria neglecta TaxID=209136 RepID=A0AAD9ZAU1_9LECA|nr:hypothetical protein OEA41_002062 [Lepraria neglecta]
MKLIVAGASGFVATEVIRQSLGMPKITSVIAVERRPVSTPLNPVQGADDSKLHSFILDDYGSYPGEVIKQFAGADACIWTVAITPSKSRGLDFGEVRRVCQDYTLAGLQAMFEAGGEGGSGVTPFCFMYMSGMVAERDQNKMSNGKDLAEADDAATYQGETENRVLAFAAEHNDAVEARVSKPGLITTLGQILKTVAAKYVISLPNVDVTKISAAMLYQVINGFEQEPLENDYLVRIGRQALRDAV